MSVQTSADERLYQIRSRICVLSYLDGDDPSTVIVGWHRIDEGVAGKDDGQDWLRLESALGLAGLPPGTAMAVSYMDIPSPACEQEAAAALAELGDRVDVLLRDSD